MNSKKIMLTLGKKQMSTFNSCSEEVISETGDFKDIHPNDSSVHVSNNDDRNNSQKRIFRETESQNYIIKETENPWDIQSIYEFLYYNCPTCTYKNSSKQSFINHAFEIHSDSIGFLSKVVDNSLNDVVRPWETRNIKSEIEDPFYITDSREFVEVNMESYDDGINDSENFENRIESNDTIKKEDNISTEIIQELQDQDVNETKPYNCKKCDKSFIRKDSLNSHMKVIHEGFKKHRCGQCEMTFGYYNELKKHAERDHKGVKPFKCDKCDEAFISKHKLKVHITRVHICKLETLKSALICYHCGKDFERLAKLSYHILSEHEINERPKCEHCKKTFSHNGALKEHIKTVHEKKKDYECDKCEKAFTGITSLRKHYTNVHEGLRSHFQCEKCGKDFNTREGLNLHVKNKHVEENTKNFHCEMCSYAFDFPSQLTSHIKHVHEGLKDFTCDVCGKAFGYR